MGGRGLLATAAIVVLAACGGGDGASPAADGADQPPTAESSVGDEELIEELLEPGAVCQLIDADEIDEVLGPLGQVEPGVHDYAYGGCVWELTPPEGDPARAPSLHVTVLDEQTFTGLDPELGEPIDQGPAGASWFERDGGLWFGCGGDLRCGVVAGFDPPSERLPVALEVARLLEERLADRDGV